MIFSCVVGGGYQSINEVKDSIINLEFDGDTTLAVIELLSLCVLVVGIV